MFKNLFSLIVALSLLAGCAPAGPTATPPPAATSTATATATPDPLAHTACADGADLTGQTVSFYHILDPYDQVDTVYDPLRAGYADAAEYFNAHGGVCGATLSQVFDETHWGNFQTIYGQFAALNPKPVVVTLHGSLDAAQLAPQLAADQIPALNVRGGSTASAYGEDGRTPGWVFATNPLYADQGGAFCDYIAANPDRFPHPVIGFMHFNIAWAQSVSEESLGHCESLGIGYAGTSNFSGDATYIHPHIQNLIDAGANIIYTISIQNGPALLARTLAEMGLQDKVTLATFSGAMDPYVAFSGEADLGADGVPMISGMLGSLPLRSWAETGHPGIQLITAQADLHQRPLTMRNNGYVLGWNTTDLLIETYIQTGNRVGFDHITGAEIKKTLENIVYAPLGGVEQIDFQGGARRALAENRIGQMNYLGQDGKTPAGGNNPPMVVTENGQQHLVPMLIPLTDYQPAPDLRPGGADAPAIPTPAGTPAPTPVPMGTIDGRILFGSARSGNPDVYIMNGDGSGLAQLTSDPAADLAPRWSPDGEQIAFFSDYRSGADVFVMNADGSGLTQLTDSGTGYFDISPAWSPDGTKIAFMSNRDGNEEIYAMNADGSNETRLTEGLSADMVPGWSPDGERIVFCSNRAGQTDLYLMNADGSGISRLTEIGTGNPWGAFCAPRWSPDGTKIALVSAHESGRYEIYVMQADGSGLTCLTCEIPGPQNGPSWSPDGTQILYSSPTDHGDLHVMNADGSGQIRLTDDPADDFDPDWQP